MEIITRAAAKAAGLTRYYTGRACPRWHHAERMVSTKGCVECLKADTKRRNKTEHGRARMAARNASEKGRAARARYSRTEKGRAASARADARWATTEHGRVVANERSMRRHAMKRKATPSWCEPGTEAHEDILDIYATTKELEKLFGVPMHVDHIVPLARGGQHRPDNLQPLKAAQNLAKGARLVA